MTGEESVRRIGSIIPQHGQAQYALSEQLADLRVAAVRLGLYDAYDHLFTPGRSKVTGTAEWLFEALVSATTRDELDFLCLGAPREILAVIRSLDHDGSLSDATPGASETVGGGSGTPCPAAPASGDGQRNRNTADLPVADIHRCSICEDIFG